MKKSGKRACSKRSVRPASDFSTPKVSYRLLNDGKNAGRAPSWRNEPDWRQERRIHCNTDFNFKFYRFGRAFSGAANHTAGSCGRNPFDNLNAPFTQNMQTIINDCCFKEWYR
ncbi:MAG: hypothetical protein ACK4NS_02040 [Saprospiraceae bacterium]